MDLKLIFAETFTKFVSFFAKPQCDPPDGFVVQETKFPVQQKITRSILFPLDRVTNEFPVISLSTPSTFLDYEY